MPLGPRNPVWRQLYDALAKLARECSGPFAFVLDEGNGLWCVGIGDREATVSTRDQDEAAERFYQKEVAPRAKAMREGKRIKLAVTEGDDLYAATSFAAIYMLVVWFEQPFATTLVHAQIRAALPEIERLTLLLPPSGGPTSNEGAAKQRA